MNSGIKAAQEWGKNLKTEASKNWENTANTQNSQLSGWFKKNSDRKS
ncbi:MAG: hypothetical protein VKK42_09485 [Lyngbya sp.]|nr:hypothetical protein [Lyngbya sp.]